MTNEESEIRRKLRVIERAEEIGSAAKAYRYYGVPKSTFYRWRQLYREQGDNGLINRKPIPGTHPNRTFDEIVEKILYLRKKYHLGPMRIMWYMARYHDLKVSDVTISRVLKRHGVSRLPRNVGRRKVHTKRYEKQVPGHHIQMDVKYKDDVDLEAKLAEWEAFYNFVRPHGAHGGKTPYESLRGKLQ